LSHDFLLQLYSYLACTFRALIVDVLPNVNICGLSVSMFLFNSFIILLHRFNKCHIIYFRS